MRLLGIECDEHATKLKDFSDWTASIGDGVIDGLNDGHVNIDIPADILLKEDGDALRSIVSSTHPLFMEQADLSSYLCDRAILAPTLDVVETINQFLIHLDHSEGRVYLSSDSISKSDSISNSITELHTVEFLNNLKCSGTPNHDLLLKVGTPVMLLRNIDHANGLCNGTKLIITRLDNHVLEAKVLCGQNAGHKVLIPRMTLTPADPRLPFKFQRRHFPLIVSYAMTINKIQGQSLAHVGLFLKRPVFSHGQLYVAVSRVTAREGLKMLVCKDNDDDCDSTVNVVYHEVFQNL